MSTAPGTRPQNSKPPSCLACQRRKVKCDRRSPCGNCVKHQVTCVPPVKQARQRRRRFPERELLDRLQIYENLLRKNGVDFEPLHGEETPGPKSPNTTSTSVATTTESEPGVDGKYDSPQGRETSSESHDSNDFLDRVMWQSTVSHAWEGLFDNDNHLLFGANPGMDAHDRSSLHPPVSQILRLWQVYLDNVNPLLKVTHSPSLQGRIIEAVADLKSLEPRLEALMFSIYCIATCTLSDEACEATLGAPKKEMLGRFQMGCQRSLLNCRFLRTSDRDCLTAFFLYLLSMRPMTDPMCLSPMLGIAVRIAQRMRIHEESALARCSVFEAEMRRRLWWALVHFDTRISQLSYTGHTILDPTWDCRIPANVNDSELRPDMKAPPMAQGRGTDAVFAVTRAEMGEYVRNTPFFLEFTNPALKPLTRKLPDADLPALEKRLEEDYVRHFDQANPLHYMATWTLREHVAKCYILSCVKDRNIPPPRTEQERTESMARAFRVLECDTRLSSSPLTLGYRWFQQYRFPFPAYIGIVEQLRRWPTGELADRAWEVMYENYEARFGKLEVDKHPIIRIFAHIVFKAWDVLQAAAAEAETPVAMPRIIASMEQKMADSERSPGAVAALMDQRDGLHSADVDLVGGAHDYMPMDLAGLQGMGFMGGFEEFSWTGPPSYALGDMITGEGIGSIDLGPIDPDTCQ